MACAGALTRDWMLSCSWQTDSSRKFYSSLRKQNPDSAMAERWLLERGLLSGDELEAALENRKCVAAVGCGCTAYRSRARTPAHPLSLLFRNPGASTPARKRKHADDDSEDERKPKSQSKSGAKAAPARGGRASGGKSSKKKHYESSEEEDDEDDEDEEDEEDEEDGGDAAGDEADDDKVRLVPASCGAVADSRPNHASAVDAAEAQVHITAGALSLRSYNIR